MSASEGADGEQWADDLPDFWDDVADDPPQAAPDPPDAETSMTGSQVLLRQRGTQRFVTWDRGDVLDAEPEPAERGTL